MKAFTEHKRVIVDADLTRGLVEYILDGYVIGGSVASREQSDKFFTSSAENLVRRTAAMLDRVIIENKDLHERKQ